MKKLAFILFAGLSMTMSARNVKGKNCGSWVDNEGQLHVCCSGNNGQCVVIVTTAEIMPHTTLTIYNDGNPQSIRSVYEVTDVNVSEDDFGATIVAHLLD